MLAKACCAQSKQVPLGNLAVHLRVAGGAAVEFPGHLRACLRHVRFPSAVNAPQLYSYRSHLTEIPALVHIQLCDGQYYRSTPAAWSAVWKTYRRPGFLRSLYSHKCPLRTHHPAGFGSIMHGRGRQRRVSLTTGWVASVALYLLRVRQSLGSLMILWFITLRCLQSSQETERGRLARFRFREPSSATLSSPLQSSSSSILELSRASWGFGEVSCRLGSTCCWCCSATASAMLTRRGGKPDESAPKGQG